MELFYRIGEELTETYTHPSWGHIPGTIVDHAEDLEIKRHAEPDNGRKC